MNIQTIIDNYTAQQLSKAAGVSLSLAKQWKTGEKDWRNSKFSAINSLLETYGDGVEQSIESEYLDRFDGSPIISDILKEDDMQRTIEKAIRIAKYSIFNTIDEEMEDCLPDLMLDGLAKYAKDWGFWFSHADKITAAPLKHMAYTIDSGDYQNFLKTYFPDWEESK